MWRSIAIVLGTAVSAIGCGGVGDLARRDPGPRPCPEGTEFLRARDIVGQPPPSGYQLVRGDKTALRTFADQFRDPIGEAWRGYDARVLVRPNKVNGTAVVVINVKTMDADGGKGLIRGLESAGDERGVETQPITIAGQEGRLIPAIDGGYIAMAPASKCAFVALVADRKPLVTDAASVIP